MMERPKPDLAARNVNNDTERVILRLAAIAIDVRGMLSPHEISNVPALDRALLALDELFCDRQQEPHAPHSEIDPPQ